MRRVLYLSILALTVLGLYRPASAQVSVGIGIGGVDVGVNVGYAPPPIPEYEQPPCPQEGYMWVPGYWNWDGDDADYYWVPGTWVMAPQPGLLWTPAYWGYENGAYAFHDGYWANEVGFYGGINYGYGYFGEGFGGGRWDNGRFMYNTAVLNVNQTVVRTVYVDKTVIVNNTGPRVSFNGGQGGTNARPTPRDEQVAHARHFPPAQPQLQNRQAARSNPQLRASANQGKPPVAATAKPGDFHDHVVAAKAPGGAWHPPADRRAAAKPNNNARPGETPRPGSQNTRPGGNQMNQRDQQQRQQQQNRQQQRPEARPLPGRPQQERPQQERPQQERPQQARPQPERPQQERPQPERPQPERPQQAHPPQERPQQDRPQQERPQHEKPQPDQKPQQPQ